MTPEIRNSSLLDNGFLGKFLQLVGKQTVPTKLAHVFVTTDKYKLIEELLGVVVIFRLSRSYKGGTRN